MACDLHTHSTCSDGTETPEELAAHAARLGLHALALTDHNTVDGLGRFRAAAAETQVLPVPGCEFTTEYQGTELHILGLFIPESREAEIRDHLAMFRRAKEESNRKLVAALARDGYVVDYEALVRASGGAYLNRANLAAELMDRGYVSSVQEAFHRLLNPGRGYYDPPMRAESLETIAWIRQHGMVAVWAHPYLNMEEPGVREFLPKAREAGLDGMEVFYSSYDRETTERALAAAKDFDLLPSGGSDYHGTNKPAISLGVGKGSLQIPDGFFEALRLLSEQRT